MTDLGNADRIKALEAENARMREALEEIATTVLSQYEKNGPGLYGIGRTDGHRHCATIARAALAKAEGQV